MQPYLLPYIGYYQLIGAVDVFVVYDNVKYTKKGWINRNRYLRNGSDATFSLPLAKDSDSLHVRDRRIADSFDPLKLLNQLREAYAKAPYCARGMALVEQVFAEGESCLFEFLRRSIDLSCASVGIRTPLVVSSTLDIDHGLHAQDKVLAICEAVGATSYVNPIGGVDLYSRSAFAQRGIALGFLQTRPFEYRQSGGPFVPWLSILDVIMFNPEAEVRRLVEAEYDLV